MNIFESMTGKDFLVLILVVCIVVLFVLSVPGDRVVKIQPIKYIKAAYERFPEKPILLAAATKDAEALGEKSPVELLFFLINAPLTAMLTPTWHMTEVLWYAVGVVVAFVVSLPDLILFESELILEEVKT